MRAESHNFQMPFLAPFRALLGKAPGSRVRERHLLQKSSPGVFRGAACAASGCWGTGGDTFFSGDLPERLVCAGPFAPRRKTELHRALWGNEALRLGATRRASRDRSGKSLGPISPRRGSVEDSIIRRANWPILSFRQRSAELESAARSSRQIAFPRRGECFSPRLTKPKTRTSRADSKTGNERV